MPDGYEEINGTGSGEETGGDTGNGDETGGTHTQTGTETGGDETGGSIGDETGNPGEMNSGVGTDTGGSSDSGNGSGSGSSGDSGDSDDDSGSGSSTGSRLYNDDIIDVELTTGTVARSYVNHILCEGDAKHNRYGARLYRNGEPLDLNGVQVTGYFIRPDGQTVVIDGGTLTGGNLAIVKLPQACYAHVGNFTLSIKIYRNSLTGTVRVVDGTVMDTTTGSIVDPGNTVPNIDALLAAMASAGTGTGTGTGTNYNTTFGEVHVSDGETSIGNPRVGSLIVFAEPNVNDIVMALKAGGHTLYGVGNISDRLDMTLRIVGEGESNEGEIFVTATNSSRAIRYVIIPHLRESSSSGGNS